MQICFLGLTRNDNYIVFTQVASCLSQKGYFIGIQKTWNKARNSLLFKLQASQKGVVLVPSNISFAWVETSDQCGWGKVFFAVNTWVEEQNYLREKKFFL